MTEEMASRRHRSFRMEAVVLRHNDWGEADRMLTLYTLEMGKLRALAKGVRKVRSRKAGHLEPLTQVSLLLARGRDLLLVTQAETIQAFPSLHEDLAGMTYGSYVVELLDRFTYEEGDNPALYRLIVDTLSRLAANPERRDLTVRYFEVRLLDLVGFRPQLFNCVVCRREIQPADQYFSSLLGGVVCPVCGPKTAAVIPISLNALRYLRHFQRSNYTEALRAQLSPEFNRELELTLQYYITYLLERGLNTPPFLKRLRQGAPDHGV